MPAQIGVEKKSQQPNFPAVSRQAPVGRGLLGRKITKSELPSAPLTEAVIPRKNEEPFIPRHFLGRGILCK